MKEEQLFRAREFAKKTGATVRTLHHYDRIGLLKPAGLKESGHRLYGKNAFCFLPNRRSLSAYPDSEWAHR